jgi:beta-1,4-mannosyl-glycoprotein beta-1,4-N-acetylglucosaminyltransferase
MIVDCVTFNGEHKMLQLRMLELAHLVDKFIVVEMSESHSGVPKKRTFDKSKLHTCLSPILHKIHYEFIDFDHNILETEDLSTLLNYYSSPERSIQEAWVRENYQRNALGAIALQHCKNSTDLILLSDVDEIPDPNIIAQIDKYAKSKTPLDVVIQMFMFYFNIQTVQKMKANHIITPTWNGTRVVNLKTFIEKYNKSTQLLRDTRNSPHVQYTPFGWHMSFFSDIDGILNKLRNISHQEFNVPEIVNPEFIEQCIKDKKSLFGESHIHEYTDLAPYVPLPTFVAGVL